MQLYNKTKNTIISNALEIADTFIKRFSGLMFRKSFGNCSALLIKPCNSIHMFFMRFPIDVIFLSKDNEIIKIYKNLKPWRISAIIRHAVCVIELPAGTIDNTSTVEGDIIIFK